jgi:hypothetical protein
MVCSKLPTHYWSITYTFVNERQMKKVQLMLGVVPAISALLSIPYPKKCTDTA